MGKRKNLRKIPAHVSGRIEILGIGPLVVACKRHYSVNEIKSGKLNDFGISVDGRITDG